jgi:DNA-binding NarL/FixJ family response regulator
MDKKINMVVADDHKIFCQSFKMLLKSIPFVEHVYVTHNGAEALAVIRERHIDLALLDVRMPVMDGLKAADFILRNHPSVKVISMTHFDADATVLDMLRVGPHGILLKQSTDYTTLEMAIKEVLIGSNYYPEEVRALLSNNIQSLNEPSRTQFTPREHEVLRLTCRGETAKEIANTLVITSGSVENYRKELLRKSKTRNVAELVAFAMRNGIV